MAHVLAEHVRLVCFDGKYFEYLGDNFVDAVRELGFYWLLLNTQAGGSHYE